MEDIAQPQSTPARRYGDALKIPMLRRRGDAKPLADARVVNKGSGDYQAGYEAGAAAGAEHLAAEQSRLADVGASLKNALRDVDERCRNECVALIEKLFAALAPTIARQSALAEIIQIIQKEVVSKKQPLTIRAHPELVADLAMTDAGDVSDTVNISIEADEQLNPNAIDIRWSSGGMFHDPDALIADIARVFADKDTSIEE